MKKQFLSITLLGLVLVAAPAQAWFGQTRTPLSLERGPMSFQNYFDLRPVENEHGIGVDYWTGIYGRVADSGFGNRSCFCGSSQPSTNQVSLSQLYFGKSCFRVAEAFANAVVSAGPASNNNPWVSIAEICPKITYNEFGVWFGTQFATRFGCDDDWTTGLRVRVPFRYIDVDSSCSDWGENGNTPSDLAAVYQTRTESITVDSNTETQTAWAARLDFLSALNINSFDTDGNQIPLVTFPATGDIVLASQNLSGGLGAGDATTDSSPFTAIIQSNNGSMPESVRWADVPTVGSSVVQQDGSGLSNLQRGRIANDINYNQLSTSDAALRQLFVVPNVGGDTAASPGTILPSANTVGGAIATAVQAIDPSVLNYFDAVGINFCDGRTKGMGDTDFELYLGRRFDDSGWLEGRINVVAPTGIKVRDPFAVLQQPTGNNGHPEFGIGLGGGYVGCKYARFDFNMRYSWVLKARNNIATPFAGATVKNLGACIAADVSWQEFIANLNFTLLNPQCDCMGLLVGYQAYVKNGDKVTFAGCPAYAPDLNGNMQLLDAAVYTNQTARVAHKVRTEAFFNQECGDVYLGFTQVVAGQNIAKETDLHIGINVRF